MLFGNAEVRIAEFSWRRQGQVVDGRLQDDGLVRGAIVSLGLTPPLALIGYSAPLPRQAWA